MVSPLNQPAFEARQKADSHACTKPPPPIDALDRVLHGKVQAAVMNGGTDEWWHWVRCRRR